MRDWRGRPVKEQTESHRVRLLRWAGGALSNLGLHGEIRYNSPQHVPEFQSLVSGILNQLQMKCDSGRKGQGIKEPQVQKQAGEEVEHSQVRRGNRQQKLPPCSPRCGLWPQPKVRLFAPVCQLFVGRQQGGSCASSRDLSCLHPINSSLSHVREAPV